MSIHSFENWVRSRLDGEVHVCIDACLRKKCDTSITQEFCSEGGDANSFYVGFLENAMNEFYKF